MEYSVKILAEKYVEALSNFNTTVKIPQLPATNFSAYTDNEYIKCINSLNQEFDQILDLKLTEDFIKGE